MEETNVGVHALLITPTGEVILQQRDTNPNIVNSGLISMFGGTIKKSENLIEGLKRELSEELDLNIEQNSIEKFNTYYKTQDLDGVDWEVNVFIIRNITSENLRLLEGKGIIIETLANLVQNDKLTRITRLAVEDFQKLEEK